MTVATTTAVDTALESVEADEQSVRERIAALTIELGRAIIANASILEEIPDGAGLVLLPDGADEAFIEANIALGLDALRKGRSVYFKRLAPGEWGIGSSSEPNEQVGADVSS